MPFDAKAELQKHGWKEGRGLGRTEDGMKEMIKVHMKHSRSGMGHSVGEELTYRWWDHVFDKAANNLQVTTDEHGVTLSSSGQDVKVSRRKRRSSNRESKHRLYQQFIKTSTLTHGSEECVERSKSRDEDNACPPVLPPPISDEALHSSCGGRTGHGAARHGHLLSGKLARLAQQEMTHLSASSSSSPGHVVQVKQSLHADDVSQVCRPHVKKSKKKKKKLKRTCDDGGHS